MVVRIVESLRFPIRILSRKDMEKVCKTFPGIAARKIRKLCLFLWVIFSTPATTQSRGSKLQDSIKSHSSSRIQNMKMNFC
eukprot:24101_6